jgi:hypothetical protein
MMGLGMSLVEMMVVAKEEISGSRGSGWRVRVVCIICGRGIMIRRLGCF